MNLKSILLVSALGVFGAAHANDLALFSFETSTVSVTGTDAGPYAADSGAGSAVGHHTASSTYNNVAGNGSAKSFSSNTWAIGDYYQFSASTLGYSGVTLSFDQTSSNTGPGQFTLAYSTNGTSFTNFADYTVLANGASPNLSWSASTPRQSAYTSAFDLSGVTGLSNASTIYLRLFARSLVPASSGSTFGAGGTSRVDNFLISATPVQATPEPSALAALGVGALALLRRRRKA